MVDQLKEIGLEISPLSGSQQEFEKPTKQVFVFLALSRSIPFKATVLNFDFSFRIKSYIKS